MGRMDHLCPLKLVEWRVECCDTHTFMRVLVYSCLVGPKSTEKSHIAQMASVRTRFMVNVGTGLNTTHEMSATYI